MRCGRHRLQKFWERREARGVRCREETCAAPEALMSAGRRGPVLRQTSCLSLWGRARRENAGGNPPEGSRGLEIGRAHSMEEEGCWLHQGREGRFFWSRKRSRELSFPAFYSPRSIRTGCTDARHQRFFLHQQEQTHPARCRSRSCLPRRRFEELPSDRR